MSTVAGSWPFDANGAPVEGIAAATWHYGSAGGANAAWLEHYERQSEELRNKLEHEYQRDRAAERYERIVALRNQP